MSSHTHLQASNLQHKETFSDTTVAETLLEGKQRDELCEKIKQIPMSAATTTRKSEMLSDDASRHSLMRLFRVPHP